MDLGHNLRLHFGVDENPFGSRAPLCMATIKQLVWNRAWAISGNTFQLLAEQKQPRCDLNRAQSSGNAPTYSGVRTWTGCFCGDSLHRLQIGLCLRVLPSFQQLDGLFANLSTWPASQQDPMSAKHPVESPALS